MIRLRLPQIDIQVTGTQLGVMRDICHGSHLSPNTTRIQALEDEDAKAVAATGISPIRDPALRELLVFFAIQWYNLWKLREHNDLVKYLVHQGSPGSFEYSRPVREVIDLQGHGAPFMRPDVEAALIRTGWRAARSRALTILSLTAEDEMEHAEDLFVALVQSGLLVLEPEPNEAAVNLVLGARSAYLLKYLLNKIPLQAIPKRKVASLLMNLAALGIKDSTRLLLDQGVDPNIIVFHRDMTQPDNGTTRQSAIHCAIKEGHIEIVRLLLEHGAGMLEDGLGRTPLERAKIHNQAVIIEALVNDMEQKGLPLDHIDPPTDDLFLEPWKEDGSS